MVLEVRYLIREPEPVKGVLRGEDNSFDFTNPTISITIEQNKEWKNFVCARNNIVKYVKEEEFKFLIKPCYQS